MQLHHNADRGEHDDEHRKEKRSNFNERIARISGHTRSH